MADPAPTTAERILDALVAVIVEGGLPAFSVQEVADRAGVSHRTVYRHFPTRESLLEGLSKAVGARMKAEGVIDEPGGLDELPGAVARNWRLFARHARTMEASVRFGVGAAIETRDRRQRSDLFHELVAQGLPVPSEADAVMGAAVVRLMASSRAWLHLRDAGLEDEQAARAATWATTVLIEALRAGRTPSLEPLPDALSLTASGPVPPP
ncbi:MAG: TetR/AcrR family transcriptional regulator [Actinomycetota bacterium]